MHQTREGNWQKQHPVTTYQPLTLRFLLDDAHPLDVTISVWVGDGLKSQWGRCATKRKSSYGQMTVSALVLED